MTLDAGLQEELSQLADHQPDGLIGCGTLARRNTPGAEVGDLTLVKPGFAPAGVAGQ